MPSPFVVTVRATPVSSFVTVIVTPGKTAWVASRAVPRTVAVVRCASASLCAASRIAQARNHWSFRITPPEGFLKVLQKVVIISRTRPLSRSISIRWPALVAGIVTLLVVVGLIGRFRLNSTPSPTRQPGLNVLLVTIDTLRADAVGVYGQPGGVTPWIDRLASAGT